MVGSVFWAGSLRARVGGFEAVFLFDPVLEDPSALIKGCENRVFLFVFPFQSVYPRTEGLAIAEANSWCSDHGPAKH